MSPFNRAVKLEYIGMPGALEGLSVLEFAGIGPGPFACMMLADHGAKVIRIERHADAGAALQRHPGAATDAGAQAARLE